MSLEQKLHGVIRPLISTFDNGRFDPESMQRVAAENGRVIFPDGDEQQVNAEFVLGFNGEWNFLSEPLMEEIIEFAPSLRQDGKKILVGTTTKNLSSTQRLSKLAQKVGVDAIVLAPEYQEQLLPYDFVAQIAQSVDLPMVIYVNSHATGNRYLPPGQYSRLVYNFPEKVVGVKVSTGTRTDFQEYSIVHGAEYGQKSSFLLGSEEMLVEDPSFFAKMKIVGLVSGTSNMKPELIARWWANFERGNHKEFCTAGEKMREVHTLYKESKGSVVIKSYLHEHGLIKSLELAPGNPLRMA